MARNRFSVCDVDGDGAEELILLYTTDITAAQRGFIFSCEEETGKLGIQLESYPLFTFYKSGAVEGGWSHNQGRETPSGPMTSTATIPFWTSMWMGFGRRLGRKPGY